MCRQSILAQKGHRLGYSSRASVVHLKEFDSLAVPNEETLIGYFWDRLKPSIWDQLDIEKAIDVEAKTACEPLAFFKDMNSQYARGY